MKTNLGLIGVLPYIFAGTLAEGQKIAKHLGYEDGEYAYVGTPVRRFVRGAPRAIYFCGTWYERQDVREARIRAEENGWQIHEALPPRKEP